MRISRDRTGAGLGVDSQEEQCRELADRCGYSVVKVYVDNDLSAYSGKPRPAYLRMMRDLAAGNADRVLAWHTDRLHRSNTELEDYINVVETHQVATETVKAGPLDLATPTGRMVARQLCAIARYESEHRSERVRLAKQRQAKRGVFSGGTRPYGFEADGSTIKPEEAAEIVRMANAVLSGVPLKAIARDLREREVPNTRSLRWTSNNVREILLRPRNAGFLVYRPEPKHGQKRDRSPYTEADIIGTAPWEPILPEDVWRSIVAKLTDPARRTNHEPGPAAKWLGSGIYRCPCGGKMRSNTTASVAHRPVYRCKDTGAPGHVTIPRADADEYVSRVVIERLSRPDAAELIATPSATIDVPALRAELAVHNARLEQIADDYEQDRITRAQFLTQTDRRRAKAAAIQAQLDQATEQSPLAPLIDVADVAQAWHDLPLGQQRAAIKALFTISIQPCGKGKRVPIHERITFGPPATTPATGHASQPAPRVTQARAA
ncbi:recombinase family protein [Actinomadura rudentiformis]|uniref:recombinase family protein n=1 Tax=Actinomadura rudentiformis TaxID=359158 RepID=UPI00178C6FD4|nr:recombinase family protein [Actinomadura rudentiformis]